MKIVVHVLLTFGALWPGLVWAQTPEIPKSPESSPPAPLGSPPQAPDTETDRFPLLREAADQMRTAYEVLDAKNLAEIDKLMRAPKCEINRIGPLLNRTIYSMKQWLEVEVKYWKAWNAVEEKRVEAQTISLANLEADQKRAADLAASSRDDLQELTRRKAGLEQEKRTEAIRSAIDDLIKDIQGSEGRLTGALKEFESLTEQIGAMKASIAARLVGIRQNIARLEAWDLEMGAYYEKARAAANEVCNTKRPDSRQTPLPKRGK